MNILASYSWLKEYCKTDVSPEVFAREISLRAMSVEHIDVLREKFAHLVVGVVVAVKPHPNADKLRVVTINKGGTSVDIVCGGVNVEEGMKVCLAEPGAKVMGHDGKPFDIGVSTIRGVESPGMLCGPAEVGFDALQTHDKYIWDLRMLTDASAGTSLAEALGMDDIIFDLEITTNRPDAKGMIGLAREAGVAVGGDFTWTPPSLPQGKKNLPLRVIIEDKKRCLRQMAVAIKGVKVGPSPWWMQKRLLLAGVRPINNIVDITNYVLLEYAQPLHAFDYAKLEGSEIRVRAAKKGESIMALNGKTYELKNELVLADAQKPLDIAGIMGGEHTGTTETTDTIVFVASAFDPVTIRKTARALNLYSDAQLLFEKGLSTEMPPLALARAVELTLQIAGGEIASEVLDEQVRPCKPAVYSLTPRRIRDRLGVEVSDEQIVDILTRLGFGLEKSGSRYKVTVPYWRDHDIEEEVDLTEEVARMYGYHLMPSVLPVAAPPTTPDDPTLVWEMKIKRALAAEGLTEFFGYSFIDARDLERAGIAPIQAVRVWNPLSEELGYMRPSLIPSFLRDCAANAPHTPTSEVFEISRVHIPREGDLPREELALVCGMYGGEDGEYAYRRVRAMVETVMQTVGIAYRLERASEETGWHPGRTAKILARLGNEEVVVGILGQVSTAYQQAFGLLRPVMMTSLNAELLFARAKERRTYTPVPEYQASVRDISLTIDEATTHADVATILEKGSFVRKVELADIYRGQGVSEGKKSVTYTLTLGAPDHTLTSEEIDATLRGCVEALQVRCGAELR